MRTEQLGPLKARITGGTDREGGGDGPVVVLLHGYGAPGDDLVPLQRVLDVPREVRFVFPHAPLSLAGGMMDSRAWWPIDLMALEAALASGDARNLRADVPEGLPAARQALSECLDAVTAQLAPSHLILGGFSQGAMLAMDLALHDPRPMSALALMSGTFLSESEWRPRFVSRPKMRALLSHGSHDPLLPFEATVALKDALLEAGWTLDFVPFRGQHEIPPMVLDGVGKLISEFAR